MVENVLQKFAKIFDLKTDVLKMDDSRIVIQAEIAGMRKNDVNIKMIGNYLIIEGFKKKLVGQPFEGYINEECPYGYFKKYVALPRYVYDNELDVQIDNGVLSVGVNILES